LKSLDLKDPKSAFCILLTAYTTITKRAVLIISTKNDDAETVIKRIHQLMKTQVSEGATEDPDLRDEIILAPADTPRKPRPAVTKPKKGGIWKVSHHFQMAFLDDGHNVRNVTAQQSKAIQAMQRKSIFVVTIIAFANSIRDLYPYLLLFYNDSWSSNKKHTLIQSTFLMRNTTQRNRLEMAPCFQVCSAMRIPTLTTKNSSR